VKHDSGDEQALVKIQHDWAEARLKSDNSFPKRIEADDFTVVWFDGTIVNKEKDVKTYESDDATFTEFNIDDLKVRLFGDTAIVVGQGSHQRAHKNAGSERAIRVDGHVCKNARRMESGRITGDSGVRKIITISHNTL